MCLLYLHTYLVLSYFVTYGGNLTGVMVYIRKDEKETTFGFFSSFLPQDICISTPSHLLKIIEFQSLRRELKKL